MKICDENGIAKYKAILLFKKYTKKKKMFSINTCSEVKKINLKINVNIDGFPAGWSFAQTQ